MPSRTRDRHGRGLRGPLALSSPLTGRRAAPPRPASRAGFFNDTVQSAVERIGRQCPAALDGIAVGIADVPRLDSAWATDQVPLAAALEGLPDRPAQVVVYRRPLEHRAASRRGLQILVYRTIVQQLSALTGLSVDEIDPEGAAEDDD